MLYQANAGIIAGIVKAPFILGPYKTMPGTLKVGTYKAGTVLGRATVGAATAAAKSGGNGSADGTFVIDVTNPTRKDAKAGVYQLRVLQVIAAHDYLLSLQDPDGIERGPFRATGTGVTTTIDDHIKGAFTDGATDFSVGHGFDITVPAGTGYLTTALLAAQDGSDDPIGVLLEAVDASGGVKNVPYAVAGRFDEDYLTYGTGHTKDTCRVPLRNLGIQILPSFNSAGI